MEGARWRVLVTLSDPTDDIGHILTDKRSELRHFIASLSLTHRRLLGSGLISAWFSRLSHARVRRSILPFVGQVAHSLFGVATEDDLTELHEAIEATRMKQEEIIHFEHQMLTVVNQTKNMALSNRHTIVGLEKNLNEWTFQLRFNLTHLMDSWQLKFGIESALHGVDLLTLELQRQQDLYRLWKRSLEYGHLTEDLFPQSAFQMIAEKSSFQLMHPLEWYYQNVVVYPMWKSHSSELAYMVELPLLAHGNWILYNIASFPVPLDEHTVSVIAAQQVAVDTLQGLMLQLHAHCYGNPLLCPPGPVRHASGCESALLQASKHSPLASCHVKISQSNQTNYLTSTGVNELVLSTWGETLFERCPGHAPKPFLLTKGVYFLQTRGNCSVVGEGWTLSGVYVRETSLHFTHSTSVSIPPLNLSSLPSSPMFASLHFTVMGEGDAAGLHLPSAVTSLSKFHWQTEQSQLKWAWTSILFIVIIGIGVGLAIRRLWLQKHATGTTNTTTATATSEVIPPPLTFSDLVRA